LADLLWGARLFFPVPTLPPLPPFPPFPAATSVRHLLPLCFPFKLLTTCFLELNRLVRKILEVLILLALSIQKGKPRFLFTALIAIPGTSGLQVG
jgi:hypothetical protein